MISNVLTGIILITLTVSPLSADNTRSFTILSQNVNRLFNDIDDGNREKVLSRQKYHRRLNTIARNLKRAFKFPEVIALQEVENLQVLLDLAKTINKINGPIYLAVLLEGNDRSGIDVGFLIRQGIRIKQSQQLFSDNRLKNSQARLFSRPPLLVETCFASACLTIVNVHLRSMRGLRSPTKGKRVALKRLSQAKALARWVDAFQTDNPQAPIILIGDFNALTPSDKYSDIVGTIVGKPNNNEAKYPSSDWIKKDLIDLTREVARADRYSYVYKGRKQILDYLLVNENLKPRLQNIRFGSIDRKISDHAGLYAVFSW